MKKIRIITAIGVVCLCITSSVIAYEQGKSAEAKLLVGNGSDPIEFPPGHSALRELLERLGKKLTA